MIEQKRIKGQLYGKYYKMFASKNDRHLTGQVHDQAGHQGSTKTWNPESGNGNGNGNRNGIRNQISMIEN